MADDGALSAKKQATQRLTPTQRHYLLKVLVCAEIHDELALLDEKGALEQYGPPFVDAASAAKKQTISTRDADADANNDERTSRPVVLLHMFHAHLRRFPGLDQAKSDYWQKHILPIFARLDEAHFSSSAERGEVTARKLINVTATRYIATYWQRGVGLRGKDEEAGPADDKQRGKMEWGNDKDWGAATIKRGLGKPLRPLSDFRGKLDSVATGEGGQSLSEKDQRIWKTAGSNEARIKSDWLAWKEYIIESEDGLDETLKALAEPSMDKIPARYRNAAEWVRRHVAFVLWMVFVKFPGGDDIFKMIKTIHEMTPYWTVRQMLKIANAQTMIKALLDLILARPLGSESLGQRIFFIIMKSDIQKLERKIIEPLRKAIDNEDVCLAIDAYAAGRTKEDRVRLVRDAKRDKCDLLIKILENEEYYDTDEVQSWQAKFAQSPYAHKLDWAYPEEARKARHAQAPPAGTKLPGPQDEATRFALLKLYLRERLRKRGREEVRAMGTGPMVPDAIRASMEVVFYKTIRDVAAASDLPSRLADFQAFMDDLVKVKGSKQTDIEDWIALCARHEKSMYYFMHEIRDAIKPIFDWCQEAVDYMALSSSMPWDLQSKDATRIEIDLDSVLGDVASKTGASTEQSKGSAVPADSDDVLDRIFRELASIEQYVLADKSHSEFAIRKEFAQMRDDTITNVTLVSKRGEEAGKEAQPAGNDVAGARNKREKPSDPLIKRLQDLDDDPPAWLRNETESQASSKGAGNGIANKTAASDAPVASWGYYMPDDILMRQYIADLRLELGLEHEKAGQDSSSALPPSMSTIRQHVLPVFREHLKRCLPDWVNIAKP